MGELRIMSFCCQYPPSPHPLTLADTVKALSDDHFFLRSKTLHRDEDMLVNTLIAKVREGGGRGGRKE